MSSTIDTLKAGFSDGAIQLKQSWRNAPETARRIKADPRSVVKGAALIPLYYRDSGVRGMGDFDVLVPERRFRDAAAALGEAGWGTRFWRPDRFDTRFVGLTGTPEELKAAQEAAGVPPATITGDGEDYTVDHAGWVLAYSPDGLNHAIYPFGTRQTQWNNDLPILAALGIDG